MHESRGGDISRGRPVGGRSDRAGLPGCADAWRPPAALGGVARSRGRSTHSRPAPASRTHRWRTPSRTPPRGTAPCATAWRWLSRLAAAAAPPAQGEEATGRDGGDRPTGVGGRRRAARAAAITRTRIPMPSRSHERETSGTNGCRWENLGPRSIAAPTPGALPRLTRPRHRLRSPSGLPPAVPTPPLALPASTDPFPPSPWTSDSPLIRVQENRGRFNDCKHSSPESDEQTAG